MADAGTGLCQVGVGSIFTIGLAELGQIIADLFT